MEAHKIGSKFLEECKKEDSEVDRKLYPKIPPYYFILRDQTCSAWDMWKEWKKKRYLDFENELKAERNAGYDGYSCSYRARTKLEKIVSKTTINPVQQ